MYVCVKPMSLLSSKHSLSGTRVSMSVLAVYMKPKVCYECEARVWQTSKVYMSLSIAVFTSVHVCVQSKEGMPMRFPTGVNRDRFNLITAVLAKHARLKVRA